MKSNYKNKYEQFRIILRQFREEKKLTQTEVAERLGVPQSFVSKYESGERRIDVVEFFEIAKALDVDALKLLQKIGLTKAT